MIEGQGQELLEVNARPNRIRSAFVTEVLRELHEGDQGELSSVDGGAAFRVDEASEVVAVEQVTEGVPKRELAVAPLEHGFDDAGDLFRHLAGMAVLQAHTRTSLFLRSGYALALGRLSKPAVSKLRETWRVPDYTSVCGPQAESYFGLLIHPSPALSAA